MAAASPPASALSPVPTVPTQEPASPPVVPVDQLPEAPSVAAYVSGAAPHPRAPTPPPPSSSPSTARRVPAADCNPDYTLDAEGNKHFKPECFLE